MTETDHAADVAILDDLQRLVDVGFIAVLDDVDDTTDPRFYVTARGRAAIDRTDDETGEAHR